MSDSATPASDDADRELDAIIARQRRNRRVAIVVALASALVVAGAATAWVLTRPEPRCDGDQVRAFLDEPRIDAVAVGEVCRFEGALGRALREARSAPPEYRGLVVLRAVADEPALLGAVCPGGIGGLAEAARAAPGEQTAVFLEQCDLTETGLSRARLARAPLEHVVLSVMVYGALRETDPDDAVPLAERVLAGP